MVSNPQFLAGERLTAVKLQNLGFSDTYTPLLTATTTDPNLGTGPTQDGLSVRSGNRVDLWIYIQFGSSPSAGSGSYRISLPINYPFAAAFLGGACGTAYLDDSSAGVALGIVTADLADGTFRIRTTDNSAEVTNSAPWTWAQNDIISLHACYPID